MRRVLPRIGMKIPIVFLALNGTEVCKDASRFRWHFGSGPGPKALSHLSNARETPRARPENPRAAAPRPHLASAPRAAISGPAAQDPQEPHATRALRTLDPSEACQEPTGSVPGAHWERPGVGGPNLGVRKTYLRWTPQRRARSPLGAYQGRTGSAQGSGVLIWVCVRRTSAGPLGGVPGAHWERPGVGGPNLDVRSAYICKTPQKRARSPLGACQERTGSQGSGVLIWICVGRTSAGSLRGVPGACQERRGIFWI